MMSSLSCVVLLGILHNCIQATNQCSPPNLWEHEEPAQRAEEAEKVIVGTVIRGPCASTRNARDSTAYSAMFRVHCVIKGQSLPRLVNVSGFGAVDGNCPTSTALLNKMYIAFVKGSNSNGDLSVHEVNSQVATIRIRHKSNNEVLRKIIEAVGRNVSLPVGSRNSSKPGCSVLVHHATNTSRSSKDHYNHNHMKRRKRKCRRRVKQKLTTSTTTLEATFKSTTELRVHSNSHVSLTTTPTPTSRSGTGDLDFEALAGSGSGSHVQSSWYLVLTFHSLVSLVVKYRQT